MKEKQPPFHMVESKMRAKNICPNHLNLSIFVQRIHIYRGNIDCLVETGKGGGLGGAGVRKNFLVVIAQDERCEKSQTRALQLELRESDWKCAVAKIDIDSLALRATGVSWVGKVHCKRHGEVA